jgi:hypothetical protein
MARAAVRRNGVEDGERISAALADVAKPMVLQGKEIWLGGLDSNQDSQIQNLKSCQLDDLPAVVNKRLSELSSGEKEAFSLSFHRWTSDYL